MVAWPVMDSFDFGTEKTLIVIPLDTVTVDVAKIYRSKYDKLTYMRQNDM